MEMEERSILNILVVNAGSSSHKLALFRLLEGEESVTPIWRALLDWGRRDQQPVASFRARGISSEFSMGSLSFQEAMHRLVSSLWEGEGAVIEGPESIQCIGHRVVHGGEEWHRPTRIDARVKAKIAALGRLAPLHHPAHLQAMEWMEQCFPHVPQVAVFDTAFHTTMPDEARLYPIPWEWTEQGIKRYGFHGISHHYCTEQVGRILGRGLKEVHLINCHLGNGCSLCAIKGGESQETTMGFTPLEGIMMGTRCGSIDPGILLYLMREHRMDWHMLDEALNHHSGLKGIGGSSDMRELLQSPSDRAQLAVKMFVHRLAMAIGGLAVSLGKVEVLSFTGGIGENAPAIRQQVCQKLRILGIAIDDEKNEKCHPDADISASNSEKRIFVIHTREDWMIARGCLACLS